MVHEPLGQRIAAASSTIVRENMQDLSGDNKFPYDYGALVAAADTAIQSLAQRRLLRFFVQVVSHEFNVAYLVLEDGAVAVQGQVGGEVLGVFPLEELPVEGGVGDGISVISYPAFKPFEGRSIAKARTIGSAWNGHGFELSFVGMCEQTMLIQSIYAGPRPPDSDDCLRLGVGSYACGWPPTETVT